MGRREGEKRVVKATDVMSPHVRSIEPTWTIADAAHMIDEFDVSVLPVIDGSELVGIVTDRDLAFRRFASGPLAGSPVLRVMSSHVQTCHRDERLYGVLDAVGEQRVRRMPVYSDLGDVVGIDIDRRSRAARSRRRRGNPNPQPNLQTISPPLSRPERRVSLKSPRDYLAWSREQEKACAVAPQADRRSPDSPAPEAKAWACVDSRRPRGRLHGGSQESRLGTGALSDAAGLAAAAEAVASQDLAQPGEVRIHQECGVRS